MVLEMLEIRLVDVRNFVVVFFLLNFIRLGVVFVLSIWFVVFWICLKDFFLNLMVVLVFFLKIWMVLF